MFSGGITDGQPGALAASPNRATTFNGMDNGEAQTTKGISFVDHATVHASRSGSTKPRTDTYWHFLTCEPRVLGMPQAGYALLQTSTGVMFERIPNPGQYDQTGTTLIPAGTWAHIAGVYDGTRSRSTSTASRTRPRRRPSPRSDFESPVFLGAHSEGAYFSGSLDEAAVYDHALSQQQLLKHYTVATGN